MKLKSMNYTRKRLTKVPVGRNTDLALASRRAYALSLSAIRQESLIYIDETGFNLHTSWNYGYSPLNTKAYINVPSNRGTNVSLLCAINDKGVVAYKLRKGSFISESFYRFIVETLRPKLDNRSYYLVMDNCRIHKTQNVLKSITDCGLNYRFLPPYSPQLNPIEEYFGSLKANYKSSCSVRPKNTDQLISKISQIMNEESIDVAGFFRNTKTWIEKALASQSFIRPINMFLYKFL